MIEVVIKIRNGIKEVYHAKKDDLVSCPVDRNNRRCGSWCIWFDLGQVRNGDPVYLMCRDVIIAEVK
jgi:hypothetical protein